MNLSIIILLLALLAAISVFGVRLYEFHTGKLLLSREKRIKIEHTVTDFYRKSVNRVVSFSNKTRTFLTQLPNIIVHTSHFYWRKLSKKVDDFFLRIRHKK